eukprot:g2172.t1
MSAENALHVTRGQAQADDAREMDAAELERQRKRQQRARRQRARQRDQRAKARQKRQKQSNRRGEADGDGHGLKQKQKQEQRERRQGRAGERGKCSSEHSAKAKSIQSERQATKRKKRAAKEARAEQYQQQGGCRPAPAAPARSKPLHVRNMAREAGSASSVKMLRRSRRAQGLPPSEGLDNVDVVKSGGGGGREGYEVMTRATRASSETCSGEQRDEMQTVSGYSEGEAEGGDKGEAEGEGGGRLAPDSSGEDSVGEDLDRFAALESAAGGVCRADPQALEARKNFRAWVASLQMAGRRSMAMLGRRRLQRNVTASYLGVRDLAQLGAAARDWYGGAAGATSAGARMVLLASPPPARNAMPSDAMPTHELSAPPAHTSGGSGTPPPPPPTMAVPPAHLSAPLPLSLPVLLRQRGASANAKIVLDAGLGTALALARLALGAHAAKWSPPPHIARDEAIAPAAGRARLAALGPDVRRLWQRTATELRMAPQWKTGCPRLVLLREAGLSAEQAARAGARIRALLSMPPDSASRADANCTYPSVAEFFVEIRKVLTYSLAAATLCGEGAYSRAPLHDAALQIKVFSCAVTGGQNTCPPAQRHGAPPFTVEGRDRCMRLLYALRSSKHAAFIELALTGELARRGAKPDHALARKFRDFVWPHSIDLMIAKLAIGQYPSKSAVVDDVGRMCDKIELFVSHCPRAMECDLKWALGIRLRGGRGRVLQRADWFDVFVAAQRLKQTLVDLQDETLCSSRICGVQTYDGVPGAPI